MLSFDPPYRKRPSRSLLSGRNGVRITSPPDSTYNCLGWALDPVNPGWVDPADIKSPHWPNNVPRVATVDAVIAAYSIHGFSVCGDGSHEDGFIKLAIYGEAKAFRHVARQLPDGRWTSKLGHGHDIEHDSAEVLSGKDYGNVMAFMKRPFPRQTATPPPPTQS